MKQNIINNSKFIALSCLVIITLIVVIQFGVTMATDGSQVIYTRDELSEKLDNIPIDNNIIVCDSGVVAIIGNQETKLNFSPTVTNNNDFTYSENEIVVNNSGYYLINVYSSIVFFTDNTYFSSVLKINDVGKSFDGATHIGSGGRASHITDMFQLNAGDKISVSYFSPHDFEIQYVRLSALKLK